MVHSVFSPFLNIHPNDRAVLQNLSPVHGENIAAFLNKAEVPKELLSWMLQCNVLVQCNAMLECNVLLLALSNNDILDCARSHKIRRPLSWIIQDGNAYLSEEEEAAEVL